MPIYMDGHYVEGASKKAMEGAHQPNAVPRSQTEIYIAQKLSGLITLADILQTDQTHIRGSYFPVGFTSNGQRRGSIIPFGL